MVFGFQRSSGRATAPQSRHNSVLVRASSVSSKADTGRPPLMAHPMSAPICSAGALASLPPPIAEDGCEAVPQFFPGYYSCASPQSPSVRLAHGHHSTSHAVSQRRAGSIKLPSSPGSDAGPRRYSNGSSTSSTSTMTVHSQLAYQAPYYTAHAPLAKNGTDAHYYSAQALSPTLMPGAAQHHMHVHATPDNRLSLVSLAGHTIANRHSVASLPPRSRRPASIVITHSNPLVAPAASPRYSQAMPSELSAIVQNEELPLGSYAYRRRGSSLLDHSGSSSNSSVASPALPATPKEYNWPISAMPPPPTHSNHAFGHLAYGQSMLHRNNTTKTVSHNDLAGEQHESNHYASATRSATGHIRRHLSPSRSATFATSASSPHAYQRHTYGCQLPARDDSICTLVEHGSSANDEVTMSMHKAARAGDICDDVDVDIPNVGVTGKQFAYLPPRTANFSVTN